MKVNAANFSAILHKPKRVNWHERRKHEISYNETVTVNTVLKRLSKRYGKRFIAYVYDTKSGEVKSFLQFLINGRSASALNGLSTKLEDGDVLAIIPPVGGG